VADDLFSRAEEIEAADAARAAKEARIRAALDVVSSAKGTVRERRQRLAELTRAQLQADMELLAIRAGRRARY
jgi:hypothetical protein